jgi:hypothetical protein
VEALAGGELTACVLGIDAALTAPLRSLLLAALQVIESLADGHAYVLFLNRHGGKPAKAG